MHNTWQLTSFPGPIFWKICIGNCDLVFFTLIFYVAVVLGLITMTVTQLHGSGYAATKTQKYTEEGF